MEEKENEEQKLNTTKGVVKDPTNKSVKVMKCQKDTSPASSACQEFPPKKIKKEEEKGRNSGEMEKETTGEDSGEEDSDEKNTVLSSFEDILPTLPPPYFISDPNIYDHTELDNVSPIDPGSYVATQPFVIPEQVKRPPAVDKSKDVGYLTPGVTRAIFKGRWEGITLGGNNNNNGNSTN